ncbi:ABC transporter permease [Butyrivibrio sp. MC2021]|uniref:ABC transporter permease n=1 Tax=Butyrivibrio sp. MC2021 TaxID=1408306 RepID=UPI00047A300A|nr:FtsX-like permease family protein [Butyrivibrio sp. MC2021]
MISKQIKQELLKARTISLFLALFIAVASALCANAVELVYSLNQTIRQFYEASSTSHLIQMHSGDIDENRILRYADESDLISKYEIVEMLNVRGDALTIRQDGVTQLGSVIDNAFVVQNKEFDFLLNSNNEIAEIENGYIGVPVYYQMVYGLKEGDSITVSTDNGDYRFVIADFIRDSQMNSSYISSKRFLVSQNDWDKLNSNINDVEYIIEFQVKNLKMVSQLEVDYLKSGLPSNGPLITYSAIRLLNMLTDIVTASVLILAAIFLVCISVLCVRFAMITSIDQEYMEIAIMKGLGISSKYISDIYMRKYMIIAFIGCVIGFGMSFSIVGVVQNNLALYMGIAEKSLVNYLLQSVACLAIAIIVLMFCKRAVNSIRNVNAVEALQQNGRIGSDRTIRHPSMKANGRMLTSVILGIKYMLGYKKPYIIICGIFTALLLLVLLPVQIVTTMKSEEFSTYMGIAKCDLRVDFQDAKKANGDIERLISILEADSDIQSYGLYETFLAYSDNTEGEAVYLNFERGDYSEFGVSCNEGHLPKNEQEIGISHLLANETQKTIGDKIVIEVNSKEYDYIVSGIYQDITNGGKSAKITYQTVDAPVYRSVVNINLKEKKNIANKIREIDGSISNGKITNLIDYISQTMGDSIAKFIQLSWITMIVVLLITLFTISIFMKLLVIKYKDDISTMKGIGLNSSDIRLQYMTRIIFGILMGIILGEIFVRAAGQPIIGSIMSGMGASKIVFVINPILTYFAIPLVILVVAVSTTFVSGKMINKIRFMNT